MCVVSKNTIQFVQYGYGKQKTKPKFMRGLLLNLCVVSPPLPLIQQMVHDRSKNKQPDMTVRSANVAFIYVYRQLMI